MSFGFKDEFLWLVRWTFLYRKVALEQGKAILRVEGRLGGGAGNLAHAATTGTLWDARSHHSFYWEHFSPLFGGIVP